MTKSEIVAHLSEKAGTTKAQADATLEALCDLVNVEVRSGRDIRLPSLGTFSRKEHKARVGRNLQTGATLQIPARKVPHFKPAADFKASVA